MFHVLHNFIVYSLYGQIDMFDSFSVQGVKVCLISDYYNDLALSANNRCLTWENW